MSKFNLNNSYKAVVIGGSAGSFQGVVKILSQLPKGFPLPIIMCLHRLKHVRNGFVEALSIKSVVQVTEPNDKETIKKGCVYRLRPITICRLSWVITLPFQPKKW